MTVQQLLDRADYYEDRGNDELAKVFRWMAIEQQGKETVDEIESKRQATKCVGRRQRPHQ